MFRRVQPVRAILWGCLGAAALAASPAGNSLAAVANAAALIPPSGEGIERIGVCETYSGANLYDYIDGGAPQYLEYGFREAASQELRYRGRSYIVDVYRMTDPVAAYGIFSTRRPDQPATLSGFPRSCFAGYQGLAAQGPYYLEIQADENTDSTATDMCALAALVFERGELDPVADGAAIDSVLAFLPEEDRLAGSERVARGPVSLGAALGLSAGGTFLRVVESVEKRLESSGAKEGVLWLVAGYHPGLASTSPRTTLACLVRSDDPPGLLQAIREAGHVAGAAEALAAGAAASADGPDAPAGDAGWMVADSSGRHWLAAARGTELWLAVSQLPADSLRAWFDRVTR